MSASLFLDDPYPDRTPRQILSREYIVADFTVQPSTNYPIFPQQLWSSNTTISKYLSLFRYYRGTLKVKIQFISNPLLYGQIGISVLPYTSSSTEYLTLKQQSQADMTVLEISEQTSVELELPYFRPYTFFDRKPSSGIPNDSWRIVICPLFIGTISANTAPNIQATVYASVPDIECSGYVPEGTFQSLGGVASTLFSFATPLASEVGDIIKTNIKKRFDKRVAEGLEATEKTTTSFLDYLDPWHVPQPSAPPPDMEPGPTASSNAKLDMFGDISAPSISQGTGCTRLGDGKVMPNGECPSVKDIYLIRDVCSIPTIQGDKLFTQVNDFIDIQAHPISPGSHADYISRMFRYYRGSTRILLKFSAPQMVSTRIRISLFPVTPSNANIQAVGDQPTWIHSVKGNSEFCLEIPYLAASPWKAVGDPDVPVLRVQMQAPIPQPFDVVPAVYMSFFLCSGPDIRFTGLQSFVPGILQSLHEDIAKCLKIGPNIPADYQGGIRSLKEILGRASTREPNPAINVPVPIFITSVSQAYQLDNFDYVSNLYKFFSGETRVKVSFSKGSTTGLLQTTILNTETSPLGSNTKAGNGLVMSHQAIWPVLDYTFPYQNTIPFNTIKNPIPFYPPSVGFQNEISQYLITASPTFRLNYLMPVPDFFFTPLAQGAQQGGAFNSADLRTMRRERLSVRAADDQTVQFQSLSSAYRVERNIVGTYTLPPGSSLTVPLFGDPSMPGNEVECLFSYTVTTDGDGFFPFLFGFNHITSFASPASGMPINYGSAPTFVNHVTKKDQPRSNTVYFNSQASGGDLYLHFRTFAGASGVNFFVTFSFSTRRIASAVAPLNPSNTTFRVGLRDDVTLPVSLVSSTASLSVTFPTPQPVDVVSPSPIPVSLPASPPTNVLVTNPSLPTTVTNTPNVAIVSPNPIPVSVTSPVTVGGSVGVFGVVNPPHPVYTSSYPDLS